MAGRGQPSAAGSQLSGGGGPVIVEALGLSLDPLRRELKPLPMILAQSRPFSVGRRM